MTARAAMPRFYCPQPLAPGRAVSLPPELQHHAQRVLRLRPGDAVILFDGRGGEWQGELVASGGAFRVALSSWHDVEREAPLALTLAQGLPSADKMDWVIQKAVELGVATIQPLAAKRSVVRLSGERAASRQRHWQQVAIAACEQCGRNRVPQVAPLADLPHYLAQLREAGVTPAGPGAAAPARLMLSPRGEPLSRLSPPPGGAILLAGPEGGLEAEEEEAARLAGFAAVALGPRVLRTETAGLAALAAMMALWGDY